MHRCEKFGLLDPVSDIAVSNRLNANRVPEALLKVAKNVVSVDDFISK